MESADRERILGLLAQDPMLRRLYSEHEELESRLSEFNSRNFLTADEQMEEKRLKKRKLYGVDRMMSIVDRHRETAAML